MSKEAGKCYTVFCKIMPMMSKEGNVAYFCATRDGLNGVVHEVRGGEARDESGG